jgi:esterase
MDLYFRRFGRGPALIILHGLYGSSDNWFSIGKKLSQHFEIFLVDQRNHGKSPHSEEHNYTLLKNDLLGLMNQQNIQESIIMGHSMGGKTAMFFAVDYPERVNSLIVVDISPGTYKTLPGTASQISLHNNIMSSMNSVDFSKVRSRSDIEKQLSTGIPQAKIRQFLLKNVVRDTNGNYAWRLNIKTLFNHLPEIMEGLDTESFKNGKGITGFPILFMKGEKSDYISESDFQKILAVFPEAEIVTIPGAGHWLHTERPELFIKTVREFAERN